MDGDARKDVGLRPAGPGPGSASPEEQELALKRDELRHLTAEVVDLELKVRSLRDRIEAFVHHRLLRLGHLYERHDELDLRIQEILLAREPADPVLERRVQEARVRLDRMREAARTAEEIGPLALVVVSPEAQSLYREAARRMHPDLGRTDEERELRHTWMVRLGGAYAQGDVEAIHDLIAAWDAQVPPPADEGTGEQLVRVIRAIARHRATRDRLQRELEELRRRDDHALMVRAHRAEAEGADPLGDAEARLRARIEALERRLRDLQAGGAA